MNKVLTTSIVTLGLCALLWVWFTFLQIGYMLSLNPKPETAPLIDLLTYVLGLVAIGRSMFELATMYRDEDATVPRSAPLQRRPRPAQGYPQGYPQRQAYAPGPPIRQMPPPLQDAPREAPIELLPVEEEPVNKEGK